MIFDHLAGVFSGRGGMRGKGEAWRRGLHTDDGWVEARLECWYIEQAAVLTGFENVGLYYIFQLLITARP